MKILVSGKKPWYALLDYSRLSCWLQDILLLDVTKHMWKFLVLLVPSLHLLLHVKHHSPQILFWSHDHTTHLIISFGVCVCTRNGTRFYKWLSFSFSLYIFQMVFNEQIYLIQTWCSHHYIRLTLQCVRYWILWGTQSN